MRRTLGGQKSCATSDVPKACGSGADCLVRFILSRLGHSNPSSAGVMASSGLRVSWSVHEHGSASRAGHRGAGQHRRRPRRRFVHRRAGRRSGALRGTPVSIVFDIERPMYLSSMIERFPSGGAGLTCRSHARSSEHCEPKRFTSLLRRFWRVVVQLRSKRRAKSKPQVLFR